MKVFIATSLTEGTGGFEWRRTEAEARVIFEDDRRYCREGRLIGYETTTQSNDGHAITAEIDSQLDFFEEGERGEQLDYYSLK